jgi:hypothetical protein
MDALASFRWVSKDGQGSLSEDPGGDALARFRRESEQDLALLPDEVRRSAWIQPNGEVSWPFEEAAAAIEALAEASFVVLGLDVRRQNDQFTQETAWSAFEPACVDRRADVRAGREAALEALARADVREYGDWILITWM